MAQASDSGPDAAATPAKVEPARLSHLGRDITVFRAEFLGLQPQERAAAAGAAIQAVIAGNGPGTVEVRDIAEGTLVLAGARRLFILTAADTDHAHAETLEQAVGRAVQNLQAAIDEGKAQRTPRAQLFALARALTATIALALFVYWLGRGRRYLSTRLSISIEQRVADFKVGGITALHPARVAALVRSALKLSSWALVAVAFYLWLEFCLLSFSLTHTFGERLNEYLFAAIAHVARGAIDGLPGLLTVIVIVVATRVSTHLIGMFFDQVARGNADLGWIDSYTAPVTRRLVTTVIWLFALAMAYPYIPGSDSEAFKGLSVLLGVMVSLGATGIVGQAASGLILIYSHALKPGEFVRVGDNEGTVTSIGIFATKLMTPSGEELSVPNNLVVGTATRNFSRTPEHTGGAADTTVTIGYSTPWRQVHALLLEAARRTGGILRAPEPYVRQSALNDFYVAYRLCARIDKPTARIEILDRLHQNIQDVFNEYGVQIMSPHYLSDPVQPAVVPKEHWYAAPAPPPAA